MFKVHIHPTIKIFMTKNIVKNNRNTHLEFNIKNITQTR
jgi:hypothetical protein